MSYVRLTHVHNGHLASGQRRSERRAVAIRTCLTYGTSQSALCTDLEGLKCSSGILVYGTEGQSQSPSRSRAATADSLENALIGGM